MHSLANASLLLPETLGLSFSFSFVYLQATKGMRESYVTQAEMDFQQVNGVDQAMQPGSYNFAENASGPLSTLEDVFFVFDFQTHLWLKLLCCQMPAATTMVPRVLLFLTTLRSHVSIGEYHLFSLVSAIWQTMHFALLRALLRCKTQLPACAPCRNCGVQKKVCDVCGVESILKHHKRGFRFLEA